MPPNSRQRGKNSLIITTESGQQQGDFLFFLFFFFSKQRCKRIRSKQFFPRKSVMGLQGKLSLCCLLFIIWSLAISVGSPKKVRVSEHKNPDNDEVDSKSTILFKTPESTTDPYNVVYVKIPKCASSTTGGVIRTIGYNRNITSDRQLPPQYRPPGALVDKFASYNSRRERLQFWRQTITEPFLLATHDANVQYSYLYPVREPSMNEVL